jgi:hypothetical protein
MSADAPAEHDPSRFFSKSAQGLLLLFVLACYLALVDSPGTPDVPDYWLRWIGLIRQHGLVQGYAAAGSDYLPGTFACLDAIDHIGTASGLSLSLAVKIGVTLFALAGASIHWLWIRRTPLTIVFLGALLVSSAAHGYLDAFYLPSLILAFQAAKRRWPFRCGCLIGLSLCFKWQPLLLTPFLITYASGTADIGLFRRAPWKHLSLSLAGTAVPAAAQAALFGVRPIVDSLEAATHHHALSFQGLNAGWIVQMALHHSRHLGGTYFTMSAPPALAAAMKGGFLIFYGILALASCLRGRTFASLVWCSMTGALAYFALNVGVHENHLFAAMAASFLLPATANGRAAIACAFLAVSSNVNLMLFYGLQGRTPLSSAFGDAASVCFSIINVAFFCLCAVEAFRILARPPDPTGAPPPQKG